MTRTTFTLEIEQYDELNKISSKEKLSKSWIMRRALKNFISSYNSDQISIKLGDKNEQD